jgi:uncharacterized protein YuzE
MIRIGELSLDYSDYDERSDVLYLSDGPPRPASDTILTPEGHGVRYDSEGRVIGITFVSPRAKLEPSGELAITVGGKRMLAAKEEVEAALAAGAREDQ